MRRTLLLTAWLVLATGGGALAPAAFADGGPHFHACADAAEGARCGYVAVPLDRSAAGGGTLRIEFELYRRRQPGRPSLGTLVDVEGGPGFPRPTAATSTSRSTTR